MGQAVLLLPEEAVVVRLMLVQVLVLGAMGDAVSYVFLE